MVVVCFFTLVTNTPFYYEEYSYSSPLYFYSYSSYRGIPFGNLYEISLDVALWNFNGELL